MRKNIPTLLYFDEYREIDEFDRHLQRIFPDLYVEDLGFLDNDHVAVVYKKRNDEYKRLKRETMTKISDFHASRLR